MKAPLDQLYPSPELQDVSDHHVVKQLSKVTDNNKMEARNIISCELGGLMPLNVSMAPGVTETDIIVTS